jgi:hypothetical protein
MLVNCALVGSETASDSSSPAVAVCKIGTGGSYGNFKLLGSLCAGPPRSLKKVSALLFHDSEFIFQVQ